MTSAADPVVTATLHAAAVLTAGLGLVAALAILALVRRFGTALAVLLDFLTAAGLLRLAGDPSWDTVTAAAAVIAVRKLATAGVYAARPRHPGGTPR